MKKHLFTIAILLFNYLSFGQKPDAQITLNGAIFNWYKGQIINDELGIYNNADELKVVLTKNFKIDSVKLEYELKFKNKGEKSKYIECPLSEYQQISSDKKTATVKLYDNNCINKDSIIKRLQNMYVILSVRDSINTSKKISIELNPKNL